MSVDAKVLLACVEDLEARIDPAQEALVRRAWIDFCDGRWNDNVFYGLARNANKPRARWPAISVNQAIGDFDAMLLQQLQGCSDQLDGGRGWLCVRCNYGTGILPSLFGCETFMMDEELNTLPAARPLGGGDAILKLLDKGVPDLEGGLGDKVFAMALRYLDMFGKYPTIAGHVELFHPDVQGPIDVAEVVWGSDIFYAFYEAQPLLRDFLELVTQTYAAFMRKWYKLVPRRGEHSVHWGMLHKGALMIRNDSLMNLSPEMYVEFVRPLDQRLFDEFGGGAMHFCGRGDHYIARMCEMAGLAAVNPSQPHLNDMETIYRSTVDKGIKLLNLRKHAVDSAARPLRGQVHCSG